MVWQSWVPGRFRRAAHEAWWVWVLVRLNEGTRNQPLCVYLEGQLMRVWVSPSASVWRNQSALKATPELLHKKIQWETRVSDQVCGEKFAAVYTPPHYTHIEFDHSRNETGHQNLKKRKNNFCLVTEFTISVVLEHTLATMKSPNLLCKELWSSCSQSFHVKYNFLHTERSFSFSWLNKVTNNNVTHSWR